MRMDMGKQHEVRITGSTFADDVFEAVAIVVEQVKDGSAWAEVYCEGLHLEDGQVVDYVNEYNSRPSWAITVRLNDGQVREFEVTAPDRPSAFRAAMSSCNTMYTESISVREVPDETP